MTKDKLFLQELLALRESAVRDIDANDPGRKLASIDKQIAQAKADAMQAENARKVEEIAKKRVKAQEVYQKTVETLLQLRDCLGELGSLSQYHESARFPLQLITPVGSVLQHISWRHPEDLGLPPRPTAEEQSQGESREQKKRLQAIAEGYRLIVRSKAPDWQAAEKRLKEIEQAINRL